MIIYWNRYGFLENIHNQIVLQVRLVESKESRLSILIIDRQAVKANCTQKRGYDGVKRNFVIDNLGLS